LRADTRARFVQQRRELDVDREPVIRRTSRDPDRELL
jgi:hypothetical protein